MLSKFFKKYLKFKKKKNILKFKASIDNVSPSKIIGWCFSEKIELSEVRLIFDGKVIASAPVNKERLDVVKAYNFSGNHGFIINMPSNQELKSVDLNNK